MFATANDYPVIALRPTGEREALLVADRGASVYDRYVTWRAFLRDDGQKIFSAGYYTSSLADALANMEAR